MSGHKRIPHLIINSPFQEPEHHWVYDPRNLTFHLTEGRRPAGYVRATGKKATPNDPGIFVPIPLVNQIRERVKAWREAPIPYLGASSVTRRLLDHWKDETARDYPFYFCQIEAIETLVWLLEAPATERLGLEIPGDGGAFVRWCLKMATGVGKTTVMGMLVTWQALNKAAAPRDPRFAKDFLVVAPNLTVRKRLKSLVPSHPENVYDEFKILPPGEDLSSARVQVMNWHALAWEDEARLRKKKGVLKLGAKSDEAWLREVLVDLPGAKNLVVLNDEAHHAWRVFPGGDKGGTSKADREEATVWVGGLDRVHRSRGILRCFDLSATPFVPSGKANAEDFLFPWIVSDFGLNDAIEAGLVKTPRVVVRDDALPNVNDYRSKLYHIYEQDEVKDDLNRKGALPNEPLPDLVNQALTLLGADWSDWVKSWEKERHPVPPVMITVANRTETAARVKHALDSGAIPVPEMKAPELCLHIDSKVLDDLEEDSAPEPTEDEEMAEGPQRPLTKKEKALRLREQVDTVGKAGRLGAPIRQVVSVGMLTEGWDARTVTHILGLRAFSSQLLCEQVVGRGLRRVAFDKEERDGKLMFKPEYVHVFGVPFSFLPHEGDETGPPPPPPPPKTRIDVVADREDLALRWPQVLRINSHFKETLTLTRPAPLKLRAADTPTLAELAPTVSGRQDFDRISAIDLRKLAEATRLQTLVFQAALAEAEFMKEGWTSGTLNLLTQLVPIVERFLASDFLLDIEPVSFQKDPVKRRAMILQNMNKVVRHVLEQVSRENVEGTSLVFDESQPVRSTGDMRPWSTARPNHPTTKSHISHCVFDSGWESCEAFVLEHHEGVEAYAKNDHLGFEVLYTHRGIIRRYRPDYLIRLRNQRMLVLEVKGEDTEEAQAKTAALEQWVQAVNAHGGFGRWACEKSLFPQQINDFIVKHMKDND